MSALQDRFKNLSEVKDSGSDTSAATQSPANQANDDFIASLEEQLVNMYEELEYMNSHYPKHTPSTLTDYAKSLENQLAEIKMRGVDKASDHGIIPADIWASISELTSPQADSADLGIVEVDDKGIILMYNTYEENLAGLKRDNVMGKNFFLQVAPCTNNRLFLGKFKQGVQNGSLDTEFNYTFTYKMKPTPVKIHLYRHDAKGRNFVFVKRR